MRVVVTLCVVVALVALLVFLPRKSVHAELLIGVEPKDVWGALMDMESYGEWNPIFVSFDGNFAEGERVSISMKTSDGSVAGVEAIVDEVVPQRLLRQSAGIPGVLMAYHRWELQPHAEGTLVIQHEEYRGAAVLVWSPGYVQDLYQQGLVALKGRLEEVQ